MLSTDYSPLCILHAAQSTHIPPAYELLQLGSAYEAIRIGTTYLLLSGLTQLKGEWAQAFRSEVRWWAHSELNQYYGAELTGYGYRPRFVIRPDVQRNQP